MSSESRKTEKLLSNEIETIMEGSIPQSTGNTMEKKSSESLEDVSLEKEGSVEDSQAVAEEDVRAGHSPAKPNALADFLRNFLLQMGMTKTLDIFQTEWIEKTPTGLVNVDNTALVPSVYDENQRLERQLKVALREYEEFSRAAASATQALRKAKKDRDWNQLEHSRITREKDTLVHELEKLQVQRDHSESVMQRKEKKYQDAVKQVEQLYEKRARKRWEK